MSILTDDDGKPIEIDDFRFRNNNFIDINLYDPYEDYR